MSLSFDGGYCDDASNPGAVNAGAELTNSNLMGDCTMAKTSIHNTGGLSIAEYCLAVRIERMAFVAAQAIAQGEMLSKAELMKRFKATSATAAGIGARPSAEVRDAILAAR